jgi:hypothetical protein
MKKTITILSALVCFATASAQPTVADCEAKADADTRSKCFEEVARALSKPRTEFDVPAFVAEAKKETVASFFDPDSAAFRSLQVTSRSGAGRNLCGEVNGKNRMGGFVGYRRFYTPYSAKDSTFLKPSLDVTNPKTPAEQSEAKLFAMMWDIFCVRTPTVWRE